MGNGVEAERPVLLLGGRVSHGSPDDVYFVACVRERGSLAPDAGVVRQLVLAQNHHTEGHSATRRRPHSLRAAGTSRRRVSGGTSLAKLSYARSAPRQSKEGLLTRITRLQLACQDSY